MSNSNTFYCSRNLLFAAGVVWLLVIAGCGDSNPVTPDSDGQAAIGVVAAKKCATPPCGGGGGDDGGGSPADPKLLFSRDGDVWVANDDGSNEAKLVDFANTVSLPNWSPTADKFAFYTIAGGDIYQIWTADVNVADGIPVAQNLQLLHTGGKHATYSADGSRLVYTSGDVMSIEVIPAGGGGPTTLYSAPAGYEVGFPAVDPTGSAIAFVERDTNWVDHAIKLIEIDAAWNVTAVSTVVPFGQYEDIRATYEQNGTHLLFSGREPGSGNSPGKLTPVWVRRVAETGGAVTDIVEGSWPSAKPDGSGFSYRSREIRFYDFSTGTSSVLIRKASNWTDFK